MERLVDPLTTVDAKLWADEFMKVKARLGEQEFDHAMMLGWFANAIMQGYDEGQRRAKADAQAQIEAVQAVIRQMGEQAAVLAKDGMAAKAQVEALQRGHSQLQALVRALPEMFGTITVEQISQTVSVAKALKSLLQYRATLDATTPSECTNQRRRR